MSNKDTVEVQINIALNQDDAETILMALRFFQRHLIRDDEREDLMELIRDIAATAEAALKQIGYPQVTP